MSKHFDEVKEYYGDGETGRWNIARVKLAVPYNWITAEEYEQITGQVYVAQEA